MSRQRVPEGPPAVPAVQKLRIRYAKRGRLRFSSTRDFQRALERAVRRAGVPMAYSSGFHPHPKISYANAAPTGTASEAEYVEIGVVERLDPEAVRVALDEALPHGYDVLHVAEAEAGALADSLEGSLWRVELPGAARMEVQAAVERFLALDEALVTRTFKKGPRTFDVREAVLDVAVTGDDAGAGLAGGAPMNTQSTVEEGPVEVPCAILQMVVRHTTPAVRPDDVLTALRTAAALTPPSPPMVTRLAQGPLLETPVRVADPLAADQEAVGVWSVPRDTRAEQS
ncbi:TIGR03936 family radical SAM-associated protein [Mobilicoccus pelagius]|uniref:DUF2344 domain-containing protein n=1 Tax=Mobilicoccus pelagius NBRC 104925 TaxID=1089455 RepID=H5UQK3_9MICO|nr:TIGR03936 family radical SAM-associated protein [Mobilicoccus pelagius]GAB48011.1 hypothetical protein MOPEL_032_00530 [Mobilicoccus pelagius NBRC 104925]